MSEEKFPKPEDRLVLTVDNQEKELFMSSGLIRKLASVANELEDMANIYLDPTVQERCFVEVLVERDNRGKPVEDISELDSMSFQMSTDDAEKLTKWMGDHLMHFFIGGAKNMKQSLETQQEAFQSLAQSLTGMSNSLETKESVGDSE
jgi:hypothetical protein